MNEKLRQYLSIEFKVNGQERTTELTLNEVHLINKILKEQADNKECKTKLVTVPESRYKQIFV